MISGGGAVWSTQLRSQKQDEPPVVLVSVSDRVPCVYSTAGQPLVCFPSQMADEHCFPAE